MHIHGWGVLLRESSTDRDVVRDAHHLLIGIDGGLQDMILQPALVTVAGLEAV
jgi:hypothetical protein